MPRHVSIVRNVHRCSGHYGQYRTWSRLTTPGNANAQRPATAVPGRERQRALAAAALAGDGDEPARRDGNVDPLEHLARAKRLAQSDRINRDAGHRLGHTHPLRGAANPPGFRLTQRREPDVHAGLPGDGVGRGEVSQKGGDRVPREGRKGPDPGGLAVSSGGPALDLNKVYWLGGQIVKGCRNGERRVTPRPWLFITLAVSPSRHLAVSAHARRGERTPNQINASTHRITSVVIGVSLPGPRDAATSNPTRRL